MTLLDFMRERGIDDGEMARLIGDCSEGAVRKWKHGERVPRPKFMEKIHHASGGEVTAADFYRREQAEAVP